MQASSPVNIVYTFLLIASASLTAPVVDVTEQDRLKPCPSSPNCVSTFESRKSKYLEPIAFSESLEAVLERLEKFMETYENATLVDRNDTYFHYTFETPIGKFIDDVEFLVDADTQLIHFRSASREGYGDFGKNKRRMKKIRKDWKKQ